MQGIVLALNIGSTSTKVGLLLEGEPLISETLPAQDAYDDQIQIRQRKEVIETFIHMYGIDLHAVDIIVSRGGLMQPGPSGIYRINRAMCDDLISYRYGRHVSSLGPLIAFAMARSLGVDAVVVDPPSTDEFHELARFSGIPCITRVSAFHVLNQKAAARKASGDLKKRYHEINLVVVHMGGGITIGAHGKGRVIDATHGLSEGPFTPERAGGLPIRELLMYAQGHAEKDIKALLSGSSGLFAYLGTKDASVVEEKIRTGDVFAESVYRAMAYQISKDVGAMATVLKGDIQAVVLTGGLAHSDMLVSWIREMVGFIAPLIVYPGEDEIAVLLDSGLRILRGEEAVFPYPPL
jgi:butyrate kinase